jgi:NADP-dependent 3-hydroxy acid dehydrogenase YdfG
MVSKSKLATRPTGLSSSKWLDHPQPIPCPLARTGENLFHSEQSIVLENQNVLENKNVVITGGTSGIGLAIAKQMLDAGARVAIGGRRPSALTQALESLGNVDRCQGFSVDVQDPNQVKRFFANIAETFSQIDFLVLAAGINIRNRSLKETTQASWDEVVGINASGCFYCMQEAIPGMRRRGDGMIVNISSVAGKRSTTLGGVAYCASKFAMTALGIAAANELNADGIRVTNVYPGEVNTPILDHRPVPVTEEQRTNMLQPEDVATMILSICRLPKHAHIPEVVIKPLNQTWF